VASTRRLSWPWPAHDYIGTEHILLGLVRGKDSAAAEILVDLDADIAMIRNEIVRMLSARAAAVAR
jgi:ATP-dependent Clp protease ATP-binding subunit ClpC